MIGSGLVIAAQDYLDGGLVPAESDFILELASVLGAPHLVAFIAAWVALAFAVAAFSLSLFWAAGLRPRWLGRVGLVAAVAVVLFPLRFAAEPLWLLPFLGALLLVIWLLAIGIWLILRADRIAGALGRRRCPRIPS